MPDWRDLRRGSSEGLQEYQERTGNLGVAGAPRGGRVADATDRAAGGMSGKSNLDRYYQMAERYRHDFYYRIPEYERQKYGSADTYAASRLQELMQIEEWLKSAGPTRGVFGDAQNANYQWDQRRGYEYSNDPRVKRDRTYSGPGTGSTRGM